MFWYHAGVCAYRLKKKLIMDEDRDSMIFGKFGGAYHVRVCTKSATSSLQKVVIISEFAQYW
jgi:hypothetical protein